MKQSNSIDRLANVGSYIVLGILMLLPFHAVFTTWLGATFGFIDLFRIWKEIIIFVLLLPICSYIFWHDAELRSWLKGGWLPSLMLFYVALHVILGYKALVEGNVSETAVVFALLVNLRFLGFFVIVVTLARRSTILKNNWFHAVLWPAVGVVAFGLLQRFVLPYDFLKHFGYGPDTIPAYQTVDQKLAYRRIQSTLRGANPLGAYLSFVIVSLIVGMRRSWKQIALIVCTALCLFLTYSRSAWIGAVVTIILLSFWAGAKYRRRFTIIALSILIVFISLVFGFRDSDIVQNSIFHTDENSRSSVSSNDSRLQQLKQGAQDVWKEPLGRGPGTAGPASFRNAEPARISENYFLQIGQEVGVIGLLTFIMINLLILKLLWQQRSAGLARLCIVTLVGLTAINMVSHAWTDDTIVFLWWGLAGIAVAPAILNEKRKRYGKTVNKTS